MSVRCEEIFGPVVCAMSFEEEDLDRIAAEANDSAYGLAAYVWARDLGIAHKPCLSANWASSPTTALGTRDLTACFGFHAEAAKDNIIRYLLTATVV